MNTWKKNYKRRLKREVPTQRVWVTAYVVRQLFGGREEGGWYYDDYSAEETVYCRRGDAEKIATQLREKHPSYLPGGFYGSVLGGYKIDVRIETRFQYSVTRHTPRYE